MDDSALMEQMINKNQDNIAFLMQWLRTELENLRRWDSSQHYYPSTNTTGAIVYCLVLLRRKCRQQTHTTLYAYIDHFIADHLVVELPEMDPCERARLDPHIGDATQRHTLCHWLAAYTVARHTTTQRVILQAVQRYLDSVGFEALECGVAYYSTWSATVPRALHSTWDRVRSAFSRTEATSSDNNSSSTHV
jgi:hypothetical protein